MKIDIEAIEPGRREEFLLDHFHKLEASATLDGCTPHSWACFINSMSLARRATEMLFDINSNNEDGSTALTWAKNSEFTKYLVDIGATVSFEFPNDGMTSLHFASANGCADQLEVLLEEADGKNFLEKFDWNGRTPLCVAVESGHYGVVKYLLDRGADPNAYDESHAGYSILQRALRQGFVRISSILIREGADPSWTPGLTPFPYEIAKKERIYDLLREALH